MINKPLQVNQPKKILLIQTASIGDVILFTPVLEKLHTHFPEATLHLLIKAGYESLFEEHPFISRIWLWHKQQNKYGNLLRLLINIRKEKFDMVVNAQRFASTGLITVLSGAKIRTGFDKNPFSFLYSRRIKHEIQKDGQHEVDRNLALIAPFTDSTRQLPKLYPATTHYEQVKAYKTNPFICIAPASLWFTKQFPEEKWIQFIQRLPAGLQVYILGSESEYDLCERIRMVSHHQPTVNLAGRLSLLESAALMQDAIMNFVNDSAPMHLCSAVNAPTTAIFCSTIPEFGFGPLADDSAIVQTHEKLSCRPCGLHGHQKCPEGHFKCALNIGIKQLLDRINLHD